MPLSVSRYILKDYLCHVSKSIYCQRLFVCLSVSKHILRDCWCSVLRYTPSQIVSATVSNKICSQIASTAVSNEICSHRLSAVLLIMMHILTNWCNGTAKYDNTDKWWNDSHNGSWYTTPVVTGKLTWWRGDDPSLRNVSCWHLHLSSKLETSGSK